MAAYQERFSEIHQAGSILYPALRLAAVYPSAWFDMAIHHRAVCVLTVGVMAAGATVDLVLQEAQDATGAGVRAIAGKAIAQLAQAAGDGNDLCILEVRTAEMTPGYRFIRSVLTVAGAQQVYAYTESLIYGLVNRLAPVSVAQVTEIVP